MPQNPKQADDLIFILPDGRRLEEKKPREVMDLRVSDKHQIAVYGRPPVTEYKIVNPNRGPVTNRKLNYYFGTSMGRDDIPGFDEIIGPEIIKRSARGQWAKSKGIFEKLANTWGIIIFCMILIVAYLVWSGNNDTKNTIPPQPTYQGIQQQEEAEGTKEPVKTKTPEEAEGTKEPDDSGF